MTDAEFLDSLKNNNLALLTATRDNAAAFFATPKSNEELCYFFGGRAITNHIIHAYSSNDIQYSDEASRISFVVGFLLEKNATGKFLNLANLYSETPKSITDFTQYFIQNRIITGRKLISSYLVDSERPVVLLFILVLNACLLEVLKELSKITADETISSVLLSSINDKTQSNDIITSKLLKCLQDGTPQSALGDNIDRIRRDFYELSKQATSDLESSRTLVNTTYGWEY